MDRPSVNGLGSFLTSTNKHVLVFHDSNGNLWAENPYPDTGDNGLFVNGTGAIIRLNNPAFPLPANCFMDTTAAYGRLWMAWSDLITPATDVNDHAVYPRKFYYDQTTAKFHYEGVGTPNRISPDFTGYSLEGVGDITPGTRYAVVLYQTRSGYITGWTSPAVVAVNLTKAAIVDLSGAGTAPAGSGSKAILQTDATSVTGTGTGFSATIIWAGGAYELDSLSSPGTDFTVGDILVFPGTLFGGATPANDLTMTVASIDNHNKKLRLTGIAAHPDGNVIRRIVALTQAGASSAGPYFYIDSDDFIEGLNNPVDSQGNNITKTVIENNSPFVNHIDLSFPDEYLIGSIDVTKFTDKGGLMPAISIQFSQTLRRLITCGEDNDTWRVSEPDDPETFYQSTGFCQPGQGENGKATTVREFRGETYFLKNAGGYLAIDTSLDPAQWRFAKRWEGHGPEGPWAIDVCDDFMVWAHRKGPYVYAGGSPTWIGYDISGNPENYPCWDRINWDMAHKIYVVIDVDNKLIKFGVPMDRSTKVNLELIADYSKGLRNIRWSYDDAAATRAIVVERPQILSDNTLGFDARVKVAQMLYASNADDGLILFEDPQSHTLNGSPILQEARLAYTPYMTTPGIYRLGAVDVTIKGLGNVFLSVYGDGDDPTPVVLPIALDARTRDFDSKVAGMQNERFSVEVTNNGELGSYWDLARVVLWLNKAWSLRNV